MISVPNHQPLSSGSRVLAIVGLVLLMMASGCKTPEKLPRKTTTRPSRPSTLPKPKAKPKVDTVQWSEVEREVESESAEAADEFEGSSTSASYDIRVLLPFDAATKASVADTDDRFVNYYGGMLMAVDILNNQGKRFNIDIKDIGSRSTSIDGQVSQLAGDADVIVAPFHKGQVAPIAEYGKATKTTVVSPWLVSGKVTKDNPYYVKLMPDLTEYYQKIMTHVSQTYDADQVVIIGNDTDASKIKYLQNLAQAMYRTGEEPAVEEYIVNQDSLANGETAFDSIFYRPNDLVVIIPNYSGSDESFVYSCVRRLAVERGEQRVITYGMPLILDSDRMEYDYFRSLNMHVARSKYVDQYDNRVRAFKQDYFARYGAIPTDDAYEGYDMMMFLGEQLWDSGSKFQTVSNDLSDPYLQSSFMIAGKPKKGVEMIKSPTDVEYYVNKHIDIIKFDNGRFVKQ